VAVTATPALLLAAAGVGFGHAILPDHWVPLAVVGRTRRYSLARVARLSSLAGIAHVLVSLILGGVIVVVGLQLRSHVESVQNTIVGLVLIATGIGFALVELTGRGHRHPHPHAHAEEDDQPDHHQSRVQSLASIVVPFGAAASPDLTILPVFLAASAAGTGAAVGSLVVFGAVTITTIVTLTVFATAGGYQLRAPWLDRWGNAITAATLIVIGGLVLGGVL
jgi:nickel/cobalt transporter (NicO) family protein